MSWSYSKYGLWKQCPRKYKFRVIDKLTEPPMTEGPAMRGIEIHKMFEDYLLGNIAELSNEFHYYTDFLNDLKMVNAWPEIKLAVDKDWNEVDWDSEDMWFRCILDALTLHGSEKAVIYDWKTGKEYPEHIHQREIYACAVNSIYPDVYEIDCYHVYLDSKSVTHTVFHRDQIPALQVKWEKNVQQMFEDTWFPANPSWLCRYCHFRKENLGPCEF